MSKKDEALKLAQAVIDAARAAMDESFEAGNEQMDISIPAHLAAALSLRLDEYDREALAEQPAQCRHRIADARNPVVKSGYLCVDCGALFAAADHTKQPAIKQDLTPEQPAQQQEPFALLVRKHSWNKGQYECAPPNAPEYGRQWADERVWVYKSPQPAQQQEPVQEIARLHDRIKDLERDVEFLSRPAQRKPLTDEQMFEMAEIAWRHGWASCRDADYVGEEAEDERWGMVGAEVVQDIAAHGIKGDA